MDEIVEVFDKENYFEVKDLDDPMVKKFPQLIYATVLQRFSFLYIPKLFGDTIRLDHYLSLASFVVCILSLKKDDKTNMDEVLVVTHKIMVLLDCFNESVIFSGPDQDFFNKLKKIKWNKNANKLFDKIFSIYINNVSVILKKGLAPNNHSTLYRFTLTLLAACSALKDNRDKMCEEDLICACKTYYKLLNSEYSDLEAGTQ